MSVAVHFSVQHSQRHGVLFLLLCACGGKNLSVQHSQRGGYCFISVSLTWGIFDFNTMSHEHFDVLERTGIYSKSHSI